MDKREQIIELMRRKGPVLPMQVAKAIETNSLVASAMLSELASQKKVFISNTKVGSSPVYYLPGQETRLQNLYDNLQEKEKRGYDTLKQVRVIRDNVAEPLLRAVLRIIKDFAKPFIIEVNGQKELFWRWYLLPVQEAEQLVREKLKPIPKAEKSVPQVKPETQKTIPEPKKKDVKLEKPVKIKKIKELESEFSNKLNKFFDENKIRVVDKILVKNKEMECIIKMPSAIGEIEYYCRAKDKKRVSDSDLSSAFVHAQMKKLPALFLTTGELTKKAHEMLDKGFKGVTFKKL